MRLLKYKKIMISLLVLALAAVFCIVQFIIPNKTYTYEGNGLFEDDVPRSNYVLFEGISLTPGVYKMCLQYHSETDLTNSCSIQDGTVFEGGLLAPDDVFYQNVDSTAFHIWLFESTDQMQLTVNYTKGRLETGDLIVVETDLMWSMLLTAILFFMALLGILLWYLEADRKGKFSREQKTAFFCVALIALIASIPYMQSALTSSADIGYHLHRIEGIKESLYDGQFPVRLEPHWLYGHGYANAVFYCPFFLYLPGILRVLGFTVDASYSIYCCVVNIMTVSIAYYCFSKMFKSRKIGVICCGLYSLSIFRIYKMYVTGAVGEAGAVTFMPLVLYGFYRLLTEDPKAKAYKTVWIPLALGYAGLIQTHVLSCEITALLSVIVCVIFCKKVFVKETILELVKGALATAALTLWYLVPFLDYFLREDLHIHYVSARTIQDRGLYLAHLLHHFWQGGNNALSSGDGMLNSHPMGLGFVLCVGVFVFAAMWFGKAWNKEETAVIQLGKTSVMFAVLLMWMSLCIFPWDAIQNLSSVTASLVSSIQFPNRFLGWGSVFSVAAFGSCMWVLRQKNNKIFYYAMLTLAVAGITTSSMYMSDDIISGAGLYNLYDSTGMGNGYISGREYLPEGVDSDKLLHNLPVFGEGVDLVYYEKEYLEINMDCINSSDKESFIEVPLLLYTGYKAVDSDTNHELEIIRGENGVVRVLLPAGYNGSVNVRFVSPVYWRISEAVSGIAMCLFIFACIYTKRKGIANA